MKKPAVPRIETGVRNLDALLHGGLPEGSASVLGGSPGAGKTILAQQICFHHASADRRALWFGTLSEPTAKTLRYLSQFSFFDRKKVEAGEVQFVDLGVILRVQGLDEATKLIMQHVKKFKPAIVVIDSFKVFDDLAKSREEQRKFAYELAVQLMAWETTSLLLGEYGPSDMASNPMFSIVDGLLLLTQREQSGEQQRFLQVVKMRGTNHSRDEYPFVISADGIEVFAPGATIRHNARADHVPAARLKTAIARLDELLGAGIPRGSSLLVAGAAGTGKTVMLLEFLYRGARAGEKGILISFEETEERLRASARGFGWDLDAEIERGMVQIVFIPQPHILVEGDLLMMKERIEALDARRVAIDSVSVFLYKVAEASRVRTKIFELATIVQNVGAVGFFATDIPYGANQLSRYGVEETVVDGVILLSATEEGVDKTKIQEEIDQLKKQLESIAQGASFSGENWLLGTAAKTVVSGFVRDGSGSVNVTKTDYTLVDTTTATETPNVIFGLTGTPATLDTTKGIIGEAGVASGISVWDIDLKLFDSATPPTYTIGNLLTDVETAFQSLSSASSALGSIKMRIGLQEDFISKLTDSIDSGIGRLVDADMNEESTRLKALQTQQQLGIQSLSIANTSSENILSLFRQ